MKIRTAAVAAADNAPPLHPSESNPQQPEDRSKVVPAALFSDNGEIHRRLDTAFARRWSYLVPVDINSGTFAVFDANDQELGTCLVRYSRSVMFQKQRCLLMPGPDGKWRSERMATLVSFNAKRTPQLTQEPGTDDAD